MLGVLVKSVKGVEMKNWLIKQWKRARKTSKKMESVFLNFNDLFVSPSSIFKLTPTSFVSYCIDYIGCAFPGKSSHIKTFDAFISAPPTPTLILTKALYIQSSNPSYVKKNSSPLAPLHFWPYQSSLLMIFSHLLLLFSSS